MTKDQLEALADAFATSVADGPLHGYEWNCVKLDYLAGLEKGFELAREMAITVVMGREVSYYDEDVKAEVLKHSISCDIRSMTLLDERDEK